MGVSSSASFSAFIEALAGFCRRELAAVEIYRQALSSLAPGTQTSVLATCLRSHEERAEFFKSRIRSLHAEPPASAGVLGALVKVLEGAAAAISPRMAIATLQEEEDRLLRHYRTHLLDADVESQQLMQERVIPAQFQTHRLLSELRQRGQLAAPGP
ncbi:MAG TPA: demethoxyubiquinone hydroxylase family protein [Polyangiaceae bacterium]|jgi:demethoxyubiquinone hydroxylase (CLK1/Coq7/Cat5 family)|nr:demethoxyubiquinone hydroxylase family protein [Polyangiaceae bacterium]